MKDTINLFTRLRDDQAGTSNTEYGILAMVVSLSLVVGIAAYGAGLGDVLSLISTKIVAALAN